MIFAIKYWKAKDLSCASGVWKYHVKLLMFSPGSGLSVTSPGKLNMCFRHARPSAREHMISSRSSLTWGEQEQLPLMFSAQINSSPIMFSFTIFFLLTFRKTRNWKGKAGALETYPTFFSPSLFFLCTFTKILYHFFFYPISFCTGINTKTEKKTLEIRKGRQEHSKRTLTM